MKDDYRHLQPVKLDIIATETGRQRYLKDDWVSEPRTADWRNNLTACSQRYNLYFIAHQDTVAVFRPSFPLHRLGGQSQITITPTLANPDARGYLDPSRPHCINHLVVGNLGSQEILLLATDSGNVAAYYTASVQDGIAKEPYKFSREGRSELVGVRPFFYHWVYESAWGLSIHQHARMIAVSSNKPYHEPSVGTDASVTVFAFALTICDKEGAEKSQEGVYSTAEDQAEWMSWTSSAKNAARQPDRSKNWKTRLAAHMYNIPSVSFINSEQDRQGNFVLSTDIEGITRCWNIWQGSATSTWNFSPPMSRSCTSYLNPRQRARGWTVLALDPSSFQVVDTDEEFCGNPANTETRSHYVDITRSLRRVPGHNRSLAAGTEGLVSSGSNDLYGDGAPQQQFDLEFSEDEVMEEDESDGNEMDGNETDENETDEDETDENETDEDETDEDGTDEDESYDGSHTALLVSARDGLSREAGSRDSIVHTSSDGPSQAGEDSPGESEGGVEETIASGLTSIDTNVVGDDDNDGLGSTWLESTTPWEIPNTETYQIQVRPSGAKKLKLHHSGTFATVRPTSPSPPPPPIKTPDVPALHLSASHLRLFSASAPEKLFVYCSEILSFQWPVYHTTHPAIDRLNLTQYIPELGIVVIASQIGRVAVCSLTRRGTSGPFGLRVDWILPLLSQEKTHERPEADLLGIAAGPVHGHMGSARDEAGSDDDQAEDHPEAENLERNWLRDRVDEEGVSVTFDPEVVRLGHQSSGSAGAGDNRKQHNQKHAPTTSHRQSSRLVHQPWPTRSAVRDGCSSIIANEAWRGGVDYSRRFRLMLTYADHTVMTFELSRGRPYAGDPVAGRPNWRNRDDGV